MSILQCIMESEMDIQKEREAFEAVTNTYHCIYNAALNYYFSGSKFADDKAEIIVNAGWRAWQLAKSKAVPEGFALVPVETLNEALSWANCAASESWTDAQREEIDKHYASIENAMIEAQEPAND